MRYLAQPMYSVSPAVQIYPEPGSGTAPQSLALPAELVPNGPIVQAWLGNPDPALGTTAGGTNGVLVYQNPATGQACLFAVYQFEYHTPDYSIDLTAGAVCVYNLADLIPTVSAGVAPIAYIRVPNGPIGIALQPGTGDLYIATDSSGAAAQGGGDGGVFTLAQPATGWGSLASTAAAPTVATQLLNQNSQGTLAVCSNLAFDRHGNLWMTVIGQALSATVPGNGLACILIAGNAAPYPALFFTDTAAPELPATPLLPGATTPLLSAFSAPEGLAFDPDGNLWVANNNNVYLDDVNPKKNGTGGGSLLWLSSAFLDSILFDPTTPNPAASSSGGGFPITAALVTAGQAATYWYNAEAQFGGIAFDGRTLYVNDETAYTVCSCTVNNATVIDFASSGIPTTNPGNGSMAIFNAPYPNNVNGAGTGTLTIRDTGNDTGAQPDASTGGPNGVLWESPDILIYSAANLPSLPTGPFAASNPTLPFTGSGTIAPNTDATIVVRVNNFGDQPSNGTEILKLYWGFASTGLDWPQPWDGSYFLPTTAVPAGGVIAETKLSTVLQPSQAIYATLPWPEAQLAKLTDPAYLAAAGGDAVQAGHFCLLARIEFDAVYPFGLYFPEQTGAVTLAAALHNNVYQNAAIGWRNIQVTGGSSGVVVGPEFKLHVLGANYSASGHFSFGVETLNGKGVPAILHEKIYVVAHGNALTRLLQAEIDESRLRHLGNGRFELLDLRAGVHRVHLPANEVLPFHLEFHPQPGLANFAVRVTQYLHTTQGDQAVGGQTFVHGHVHGLNSF